MLIKQFGRSKFQMKNKKTIIYIGGFELPDKNAAAQRVLANAKILRELNYNVLLIGIDKELQNDSDIKKTKRTIEGFESFSMPYPNSKKLWFTHIISAHVMKMLLLEMDDVYAVICYNYPAIAMYNILQLCKKKNIMCLADATEWYENSGGGVLFNSIKWLDTFLRMYYVHSKVDGIISVSTFLTEFYTKKHQSVIQLPTLYDVKDFKYSKKSENKDKKTHFLYAGSAFTIERVTKDRSNIKDRLDVIISTFVKVHKSNTEFILNIYGLTKENYLLVFPEYKEILFKLDKHILFHGRCPHQEIIKSIQESDFTIFIRRLDRVIEAGFPSKYSESISYGTPVISNMISNIEPYSEEGKNHFELDLNDENNRVKKILKILELEEDTIDDMKFYCKNHKIFDYRIYIKEMETFFQDIKNQGNYEIY